MNGFISFIVLLIPAITFANTSLKTWSVPSLNLADGYSSLNRVGMGESALKIANTKTIYTNMQNKINFTQTINREDLAKDLNVNISVSGGWGLFSGGASAAFFRHIENTQFSENFTFSESYHTLAILDISALPASPEALSSPASNLYKKEGIYGFSSRYGDSFIKEIPLGAYLIVNLRVNFATALDKEKFDGELKAGFGSIFNASSTLQSTIARSHSRGTIEISAFQLGGDPTELPKIFSEKTSGGYYITTCSLDALRDCQGAIDGIIRYAQTDFNQQIKAKNSHARPEGNLVVVGEPLVESYANKFRLNNLPPLDAKTLMNRLEIAEMYHKLKPKKDFFDHMRMSPIVGYLTPKAHDDLNKLFYHLDWNWSLFEQFSAVQCFLPGSEKRCKEIIDNIKTYSKPIDDVIVNHFMNNGYYEIQADCSYSPVNSVNDSEPIFAGLCGGTWYTGVYTFKMAEDKSHIDLQSDYMDQNYHMQASGTLYPAGSQNTYFGMAAFHNLYTGAHFNHGITLRVTKNML